MTRARGRSALRALAIAVLASGLCSVRSEGAEGKRVLIRAGLDSYYDDNILEYSDDQIAAFQQGSSPDRYSILSVDNLELDPALSVALENRIPGGRGWRMTLRGKGTFHDKNQTADFRAASAEWRQSLSRGTSFAIRGYYLPRFYLRQLRDEDAPLVPTQYRRAEFALFIGSLSWRQRITPATSADLAYQFENRDYNAGFVERNSGTHQGEARFAWSRLHGTGSLQIRGGYRLANAKAADGDELPGAPPDDPDVGYHGLLAGLDGRVDLARGITASLGYELGTRDYTSKEPTDRYHYGRRDVSHAVEAGLRWNVWRHCSLIGSYAHQRNSARLGAVAPSSSEVGSYSKNRVGLGIEWSGVLWQETRERESVPDTIEGQ